MTTATTDVTIEFKKNNQFVLDVALWEYVTVQFVNPSGTINITGTNDEGTGNSSSATTNFTAIQAINLASAAVVTSIAAAGMFKIQRGCKYIKFGGAAATADKVLVFSSKPY